MIIPAKDQNRKGRFQKKRQRKVLAEPGGKSLRKLPLEGGDGNIKGGF